MKAIASKHAIMFVLQWRDDDGTLYTSDQPVAMDLAEAIPALATRKKIIRAINTKIQKLPKPKPIGEGEQSPLAGSAPAARGRPQTARPATLVDPSGAPLIR